MKKSKSFIALCKKHDVDPDLIPEITSFEEACKAQGLDPLALPEVGHLPERHRKRLVADYKLCVIADALREGKEPDYYERGKYKYYPVFSVDATKDNRSGVGLSCFAYDHWASGSGVGVRLCFPTADMAEYFGKQFIDLHTDHHLLT